jgi:hypothetical protein
MIDQQWVLVLSGVVDADSDLGGNSTATWANNTVSILPGGPSPLNNPVALGQTDQDGPLNFVINHYGIPRPPPEDEALTVFSVDQWAPFVGLSGIFDAGESINAGFQVLRWRPSPFYHAQLYAGEGVSNHEIHNIFTGVTADVAIRDNDAEIMSLSYNITLLGTIYFAQQGTLAPGAN